MAPAASTLSPPSAAASKRPADSDAAELLLQDTSTLPQGGDSGHHPPPKQPPLECPRCRSTNTKFCYYNNYSTAQPRHFCRACRRYWTHGGTLRDVPVGGASRRGGGAKRRRVSASASPPPPDQAAAPPEDACLMPDLGPAAFPFLSDGSFFLPPQLDLGALAPAAAFDSWQQPPSVVPDFFDGLAPWDDGTVGAAAVTGASWGGDIAGLDLSWQPPAY